MSSWFDDVQKKLTELVKGPAEKAASAAAKEAGKMAAKQAANQAKKQVEKIGEEFLDFAERQLKAGEDEDAKRREALGDLPTADPDEDWVDEYTSQREEEDQAAAPVPERQWSEKLTERELEALRGVQVGLGEKKRKEREAAEESAKAQLAALKAAMGKD